MDTTGKLGSTAYFKIQQSVRKIKRAKMQDCCTAKRCY